MDRRENTWLVIEQGEDQVSSIKKSGAGLDDIEIPVKLKISALWSSVMFCYIYADYFGLYVPGSLQHILAGKMEPLGPVTQMVLLGTSAMLAIPGVMIFLSLVLKPNINRWLNIILGVLYTAIILLTMWSWAFYIFYGVIEIALTGLVVWYAWNWPAKKADSIRQTD
jgi:hypothetical protein